MAAQQSASIPARLVIPSADFGGAFLSVFDPEFWREDVLANVDESGQPVELMDALTAVLATAERLVNVSRRDGQARFYPNEPYAAPLTLERWLQLLDQSIDDLNWARLRIAQEIGAD